MATRQPRCQPRLVAGLPTPGRTTPGASCLARGFSRETVATLGANGTN
jgi:hypothetical protein